MTISKLFCAPPELRRRQIAKERPDLIEIAGPLQVRTPCDMLMLLSLRGPVMATSRNLALPQTGRLAQRTKGVWAEVPNGAPLRLLSVVIPAHNEEGCVCSTIEHLHLELRLRNVPHEIVAVDDGSTDSTWQKLLELCEHMPVLKPVQNQAERGFGRAVAKGFDSMSGDAVVVMMADESDDCHDVVSYWELLNQGWDAVFGSRFIKGGGVIDYPFLKRRLNRMANFLIRLMFGIKLNDTTNAFKAYRATVIEGCRPLLSPHFNLTVELPLKTIVRGYSWTVMPVTWRNRRTGFSKLTLKEMGSRYLFICLYVWLEKYFSRGDYKKREQPVITD